MENSISHHSDDLIYPGEYVPLLKEEQIKEELKRLDKADTFLPAVNVAELDNAFKVEVAIPGVKREEFLIQADENILSVCVMHKECDVSEPENFHLHEFNYDCFKRQITLPKNVDAEFAGAEYREGILRLLVPKTRRPAKNIHKTIVVY